MKSMSTAIELIAAERQRQIEQKGWSEEHDDSHCFGQLAAAASCYAAPTNFRLMDPNRDEPMAWPWARYDWKPSPNDRKKELVKAGALIVAEIERLERMA